MKKRVREREGCGVGDEIDSQNLGTGMKEN